MQTGMLRYLSKSRKPSIFFVKYAAVVLLFGKVQSVKGDTSEDGKRHQAKTDRQLLPFIPFRLHLHAYHACMAMQGTTRLDSQTTGSESRVDCEIDALPSLAVFLSTIDLCIC